MNDGQVSESVLGDVFDDRWVAHVRLAALLVGLCGLLGGLFGILWCE